MSRCGAALPGQHRLGDLQVAGLVAAFQIRRRRGLAHRNRPAPESVASTLPSRISKASVGPVVVISSRPSDPCTTKPRRSPSVGQRLRHQFRRALRRRAHQLRRGPRRIRQRTQQIEHRPHLQLDAAPVARASSPCAPPARTEIRCRPRGSRAPLSSGGRRSKCPAPPAGRRCRTGLMLDAVAVLGHAHAGARHHERRDRRNVECAGAVAARAAGVQQGRAVQARRSPARPSAASRARSPPAPPRSRPSSAAPSEMPAICAGAGIAVQNGLHGGFARPSRKGLCLSATRSRYGRRDMIY